MEKIIKPEHYQQFVLAGKSEFVLHNTVAGTAIQYVVHRNQDGLDANVWFVKDRCYHTLLFLIVHNKPFDISDKITTFDLSRTRKYGSLDPISKQMVHVFEWFWRKVIIEEKKFPALQVQHIGKCGHCGRKLTDEVSVTIGIGPDCRKKLGISLT